MRKFIALLIALVFTAATVGFALAQTSTTPAPAEKKTEKMDKAGDKTDAKKSDKKMAAKNANGTVKSASADSIVVAGKEKGKEAEWTFAVDAKTKIKKAGKDVKAADLKAGDSVHVRYMDMDGKAVASAVTVKAGGTAKKEAKKEEAAGAAKPAEKK